MSRRAKRILSLMTYAFVIVASLAGNGYAQPVQQPGRGSVLRSELLDAARPAFVAETNGPIEFVVKRLAILDDWAFGDVSLRRPGGQKIDWARTKFADDLRYDMFNPDYAFFLLKRTNGAWAIAEISVGPTDVVWDGWRQQYNIPAALFGQ